LLGVFNWICFAVLDLAVGRLALVYVGGIVAPVLQASSV
jgi:hypothetical protein